MTVELVRDFFLWCFIINLVLLLLWMVIFITAGNWIYRTHSKWFSLPRENFDAIHYKGMLMFKTFITGFNLVPYLALLIAG